MLPITTPVLLAELESVGSLVSKWEKKVAEGVPGVDVPMMGNTPAGDRLDVWLTELIGELRLVSGKVHNLAEILTSTVME